MRPDFCARITGSTARGDREQPEDVSPEHGLDFPGAGFLDGAEETASGVVDQDVDAAEPAGRRPDDGGRLGRVGNVKRDSKEAAAVTGQRLGHQFRPPGRCYYNVAALESPPGDLPAETAGCAGDEPDLHDCSFRVLMAPMQPGLPSAREVALSLVMAEPPSPVRRHVTWAS
jgi:hypothetical protein